MKLIDSSVEIIPQEPNLLGVYKQIEIGGRTAYKSEDKITQDSAKAFVDMLISRGHTAPLEQGTVYLKFECSGLFNQIQELWKKYKDNPYSKVKYAMEGWFVYAYVTTNARVIFENGWQEDLQYICKPTKHHEKRITTRFVCSRAIANELVRHRTFSFVQESTRYCNYSRNRFNNQLTFINPYWVELPNGEYTSLYYDSDTDRSYVYINNKLYRFDDDFKSDDIISNKYFNFIQPLYYAEQNYMVGLNSGFTPQQMRDILPSALKTEVVMTGYESDWKNFFNLRCAQSAHPDMQKLAKDLQQQFKDNKIDAE